MNFKRTLIFCWGILLVFAVPLAHAQGPLRVHFLSVGYADAIVIELPDQKALLVDAGEKSSAPAVAAYLKALNISHIHAAVVTHPHRNHFGGFAALLEEFTFGQFFVNGDEQADPGYEELLSHVRLKNIPVKVARQGTRIAKLPAGVRFEFLHPARLEHGVNGNSLAAVLTFKRIKFLFTADIEELQQQELVKHYPSLKNVQCVQVPHHGGPVAAAFAEHFADTIFVASTGENDWGLPKSEDLRKFRGQVLRTDKDGTVVLESDGKNIKRVIP